MAGGEGHCCSLSFPRGSSMGFFLHPWPFLLSFPLPSLRLLHRFASAVDGKKGNGAKLLPGTTGSRAPAIQPHSASLDASRAGFLCSLCEPFLPAIDIGFPAQGHFQGCKSAVLLYLVFLFSLRGFQTCWRSQLLCMAVMSPAQWQASCCPLPSCPWHTPGVWAGWAGCWHRQWCNQRATLGQGLGCWWHLPAHCCGWDEALGRAPWVLCCPHCRSLRLG